MGDVLHAMMKNQLLLRVLFAIFICLCLAAGIAMNTYYGQLTSGPFPILESVRGTVEDVRRLDGRLEIVHGHKPQRRYSVLTVADLDADPPVTYEFTVTNETDYSNEPSPGDTVEIEFIYSGGPETSYIAESVKIIP